MKAASRALLPSRWPRLLLQSRGAWRLARLPSAPPCASASFAAAVLRRLDLLSGSLGGGVLSRLRRSGRSLARPWPSRRPWPSPQTQLRAQPSRQRQLWPSRPRQRRKTPLRRLGRWRSFAFSAGGRLALSGSLLRGGARARAFAARPPSPPPQPRGSLRGENSPSPRSAGRTPSLSTRGGSPRASPSRRARAARSLSSRAPSPSPQLFASLRLRLLRRLRRRQTPPAFAFSTLSRRRGRARSLARRRASSGRRLRSVRRRRPRRVARGASRPRLRRSRGRSRSGGGRVAAGASPRTLRDAFAASAGARAPAAPPCLDRRRFLVSRFSNAAAFSAVHSASALVGRHGRQPDANAFRRRRAQRGSPPRACRRAFRSW